MRGTCKSITLLSLVAAFAVDGGMAPSQSRPTQAKAYLGFDRNEYPGDNNLAALRRNFWFAGYWLNPPPGASSNTWVGHRKAIQAAGFGFVLLFNGRLDAVLKKAADPETLGRSDAAEAVASAQREGFPAGAVIFLDQEEGGRMLPEQMAYIHAWVDSVIASSFRAGVYCSGLNAGGSSATVITAIDIRDHTSGRAIAYWVVNDACPPSPGCAFPKRSPPPSKSGIAFAEVWQFAQSPKRHDVATGCPANYDRDGSCCPPGAARDAHLFVDVNVANSDDPSHARSGQR